MDPKKIEMLEENDWTVECESPFEIRHKDGSFATGQAAEIVLWFLTFTVQPPRASFVKRK